MGKGEHRVNGELSTVNQRIIELYHNFHCNLLCSIIKGLYVGLQGYYCTGTRSAEL